MRRTHTRVATALTALLLLSVLSTLAVPASLGIDQTVAATSTGRSTSAEVFLTGGGSTTHDEFAGAIAAADLSLIHI